MLKGKLLTSVWESLDLKAESVDLQKKNFFTSKWEPLAISYQSISHMTFLSCKQQVHLHTNCAHNYKSQSRDVVTNTVCTDTCEMKSKIRSNISSQNISTETWSNGRLHVTSFSWALLLSLSLYTGGRPLPRFLTAVGWPRSLGSEVSEASWSVECSSRAGTSCRPRPSDEQSSVVTATLDSIPHQQLWWTKNSLQDK